jgi:hypothetical protein
MAYLAKHQPGSGGGFTWTKPDQVIEVKDEALARELILAAHGDIYQVNELPVEPKPPKPSKVVNEVVSPEDFTNATEK